MKEEDLNNIALQILRSDGKNKWQKLLNTCNSMNVIICPILISSKIQSKCRFYLNNFLFPEDGIGETDLDSKCNAVDKFLNRYINMSKVTSSNKYVENNCDLHVDTVSQNQITLNVSNQINQPAGVKILVKLADLCISNFTGDLWSILNKYSLSENIKFCPKFSGFGNDFSCSFIFNNIKFEDKIVVASTRINAARILAERFVRTYTSNYKEYEMKMDNFFIFIAKECQLLRQTEISKTLSSICEYLNIVNNTSIAVWANKYMCTLILNHKHYQITGKGSNENEAFISAIEIFFANSFSPEILREIQNLRILNKIANFSLTIKFPDEWKSICNSCKLLGYKCHERFTTMNNTFSVECFIDGISCGLVGTGQTRNEAGISLGKQFVEKFKNLQELLIEKINQLEEEKFFVFVGTLCVDKFWSNNWSVLTKICSKYNISLVKCVKTEINNQIRCSMFIGIYPYEKFVTLSNHDLAFNIVTQHFLSKYGKRNLSENDTKALLKKIAEIGNNNANKSNEVTNESQLENQYLNIDVPVTNDQLENQDLNIDVPVKNENEILSKNEKLFRRIAKCCISYPKKDDWKTLCNACKCLKLSIFEKFTIHKSDIMCEVYINNQKIDITETSTTRKTAAKIVARKFINKYYMKSSDKPKPSVKKLPNNSIKVNTNSEQIFKNIAKHFIENRNSKIWDSFFETCLLLDYEIEESCESDGKQFVCQVFIENVLLDFTGKDSTRMGAKLSFVEQFIDRYYYNLNEFSKLNVSEDNIFNQNYEKTEFSKLNVSEDNISNQNYEKTEFSKLNVSEQNIFNQNDEKYSSMITFKSESIFNKIAKFCLLNPVKNDWKTLCNACLTFRCKMIERFISHDDNQIECEFYINENQIKSGAKCLTRIDAEICTAKFFIQKYATIDEFSKLNVSEDNISNQTYEKIEFSKLNVSEDNIFNQNYEKIEFSKLNVSEQNISNQNDEKYLDQDNALYENIANLCQSYSYKDDWKTLVNTCKLNKYKYHEQIYKECNEYLCKIFIKDKLLDIIGRGKTELIAAKDLARQFMEKYYKPKTSDLNENIALFTYQEEPKSDSVNLIEKPVTIPKASDLNENIALFTYQEEPKSGSVNFIEEPVAMPENTKYGGVYFLTY